MNNEEMKKEESKKAGSPLFILIIFIFLLGAVFYAPEIYQKYNKELAAILGIGSANEHKEPEKKEEDNKSAMSNYYQIGSHSTLEFNEITISNVSLENGILSLSVAASNKLDLDELDYYLEFYESRITYVGRRALRGIINGTKDFRIDVTDFNINTSTYFVVSHISETSIPKNELESVDDKSSMTCTMGDVSYTYDFVSNGLSRVTRRYTYTNNDLTLYANELMKYEKIVKARNELNGITAAIAENGSTFIYTLELDYSTIKSFHSIEEDYIFNKDTLSSVISFKMDAEGFECK